VSSERVGPVLHAGPRAEAVVLAIRDANPGVEVIDRGTYVRILVPNHCRVTRSAIEAHAGGTFELPSDLERIMASFQGRLTIDEHCAVWSAGVLAGAEGR